MIRAKYESTGRFINVSTDVKIYQKTELKKLPMGCADCNIPHCDKYVIASEVRPKSCPLVKGVEVR